MPTTRLNTVRAVLIGGPMYDPLYETLPTFERETGLRVEIAARLPHPELNAYVKRGLGDGSADVDLISTHTKYAPSQAQWLAPVGDLVERGHAADLLPRAAELSRIGGQFLQVPRNLDVRLLHYRTDLFDSPVEQAAFARRYGRPLAVPQNWSDLADVAEFFTRPGMHGFLFPGRDSGLFGMFYELLVGAGGELFDIEYRPVFDSTAGVWAASFIARLHHTLRVTPPDLAGWHYDEISIAFRAGHAAMVTDWPGSHHLYRQPSTCRVWDRVGLSALPAGPAGIRAGYAGCHSFAITATARNRDGAGALLRWLLSCERQLGEARRGAIPCRASALARVREEAAESPPDAGRWSLLAEAEHTMIIPPRFATYPACEEVIWQSMQRAMDGRAAPAEAVHEAAEQVLSIVDGQAVVRS